MTIQLTKLGASGATTPDGMGLDKAVKLLEERASALHANAGIQRLAIVCMNYEELSVEEAYRLIDPEAFQKEVEEALPFSGPVRWLNYVRVVLGLLPLILTWSSMSFAVAAYQTYVKTHQSIVPESFLKLWQDGLPGEALNFFWTGILDVVLLGLFVVITLIVLHMEYQARQKAETFAAELSKVTAGLIQLVAAEGLKRMASDADIERVGKVLQAAVASAYKGSQQVMQQALDLFNKQISPMLKTFQDNMNILHMDLDTLSKNVNDYQQQVVGLTAASQGVATASAQLVVAAREQKDAAEGVKQEVGTLNSSQQQVVNMLTQNQKQVADTLTQSQQQVASTIASNQSQIATTMGNAATEMQKIGTAINGATRDMKDAATKVSNVGQQLTALQTQDLQKLYAAANNLVQKMEQASKALGNATNAMMGAAPSTSSAKPTKKKPWWQF